MKPTVPLQGRPEGALRRPAGRLEPQRAQPRLLGGVGLAALVGLVGFAGLVGRVGAGGNAAPPAHPAPWVGPSSAGSWAPTTLTVQTNTLIAEPGHPDAVVAATDDGVWRSGDGGSRWARIGIGLRGKEVDALAATPGDGLLFVGAADGAVYALDAGRAAWRRLGAPLGANPIYSLAVAPDGQGTVLAGTVGGLYRGTTTGGWHWSHVAQTGDAAVSSIAWVSPSTRRAMASVFGLSPPVLATTDDGRTWRAAATGLPSVLPTQALLALPDRGSRGRQMILTTMGGGVWDRTTAGPWRDISAGLPARHAMPLVALPGAATTVLYAGTMGDGVYVKQGDAAWRPLGHGLTGEDNTILAVAVASGPAATRPTLMVGTAHGVFRYLPAR